MGEAAERALRDEGRGARHEGWIDAIRYKSNVNTRSFVGSYDFELRKEAGTRRITKFRFNLKYLDGNPNLESS